MSDSRLAGLRVVSVVLFFILGMGLALEFVKENTTEIFCFLQFCFLAEF